MEARFGDFTAAYCEGCDCAAAGKPRDCPRPRLLPANIPVAEAWRACRTQWRYATNGVRTGLDYAGVTAALQVLAPGKPRRQRRWFRGIRTIEAALLDVQREQWEADQAERGRKRRDR